MNLLDKIKYIIKYSLASILYYSGLIFIIRAVKLRNKVVVLMYHRVLDEKEMRTTFSHPGIVVDKNTFVIQMKCLKKFFHVISEDELITHMTFGAPLKNNSCLVTFDDGWRDNYTNAYPILKSMNLPATIFLTTDYIGTGSLFWQEKLSARLYKLYKDSKKESTATLKKYGLEEIVHLTPVDARAKIRNFITQQKKLQLIELQKRLGDFFGEVDYQHTSSEDIDIFLNWRHVKEMARNGISFGSHTINHHILTKINLDTAKEEVNGSRDSILANTGISPKTFCYPNGEYTDKIAYLVAEGGYKAAFSTQNGFTNMNNNLYAIPRINIHNDMTKNIPIFMARIIGIF